MYGTDHTTFWDGFLSAGACGIIAESQNKQLSEPQLVLDVSFMAGVCLNVHKQPSRFFFFFLFQGRIACANVLSDLYAMGVTECDNMLMLLGISNKMTDRVRFGVTAFEVRTQTAMRTQNVFFIVVFSPQSLKPFKQEVVLVRATVHSAGLAS